jgi:hypothetical protein
MKRTSAFTLGAVTGSAALIVAVPLLAQFAGAQSSSSSSAPWSKGQRPTPTQACVQAMAGKDAAYLSNIDAFMTAEKAATQAHENALNAAAAITDDTQRKTAVQNADKAFHDAMQTAQQTMQTAEKSAMDALKTACNIPGQSGGKGPGMKGGFGFGPGMMGGERGKGLHKGWNKNGSSSSTSSTSTSTQS